MHENARQLQAGEGPFFEHWTRRFYMAGKRALVKLEQS